MVFVQRSWVETYPEFSICFFNCYKSLTQSIGFWTVSMISKSTIRFNSFSNFDFKAYFFNRNYHRECIILDFNMVSIFQSFDFSKTIRKLRQKLFIAYIYGRNTFIKLKRSLVANPRIGAGFESTIINETSNWSFFSFIVIEHFLSTGILE